MGVQSEERSDRDVGGCGTPSHGIVSKGDFFFTYRPATKYMKISSFFCN